MAVVITTRIAWAQSFFWIAVILVGTGILLFVLTAKAATSGIVTGKRRDIFFKPPKCSSIPKTPVYHTGIATDNIGGQTVCGNVVIVAILVFFMMTIQILGGVVDSESARESMGEIVSDVEYSYRQRLMSMNFKILNRRLKKSLRYKRNVTQTQRICR